MEEKPKEPSARIRRIAELCGVAADDPRLAHLDASDDSLDIVEAVMLIQEERDAKQES